MTKRRGVEILLRPRTRVPRWVINQTLNVSVRREKRGVGWIRVLRIKGAGEVGFIGGGGVGITMPGSDQFWVAFAPLEVLEIRDLKGALVQRNHYLCEKCFTLTGAMKTHVPSKTFGLVDATFECSSCKHSWTFEGI